MTILNISVLILAIVGIIRIIQNAIQLSILIKSNTKQNFDRATDAFIDSMKRTDKEFIAEMLEKMKEVE